jgi:hypothetical protein
MVGVSEAGHAAAVGAPTFASIQTAKRVHSQGLKLSRITDGLSKVIMIGEISSWGLDASGRAECRPLDATGYAKSSWATGGTLNSPHDQGTPANVYRVAQPLGTVNCTTYGAFRSSHGAGAQFARADGSVTWLDESIEYDLYRRLAIRDDGRPDSY